MGAGEANEAGTNAAAVNAKESCLRSFTNESLTEMPEELEETTLAVLLLPGSFLTSVLLLPALPPKDGLTHASTSIEC